MYLSVSLPTTGCHPTGVTDLTLEANKDFLTECKEQNCIFLMLWL